MTKQANFPDPPEDCSEGLKLIWNTVAANPDRWFGDLVFLRKFVDGSTPPHEHVFSKRDRRALSTLQEAAREAVLYQRALAATLGGDGLAQMKTSVGVAAQDVQAAPWDSMEQYKRAFELEVLRQQNGSPNLRRLLKEGL